MSEFAPIADLIVPAEILAAAELPEPPHRIEQHHCRWREIPTDGRPVWRCALTWSDGAACDSVTIDPTPYHRVERLVQIDSADRITTITVPQQMPEEITIQVGTAGWAPDGSAA